MPGRGWSRRSPWPYDLRIGGTNGLGVMLKSDADGQLVAIKSKPLDAAPATYQYETQQPFLERTYVLRDLYDGMGQQTQPVGTPRRSYFGINVETAINGHIMLGPLFHAETVAAGQPVVQILAALQAGSPAVFVLAGPQVRRRTADGTWALSLTLPGGSQAQQAVRFKPAGLDTSRPEIVTAERLPPGSLGLPYSYRLQGTGGTGPYAWGIAVGHLPAGLTLSSGGTISGTPTVVSSTAFQVRMLDATNILTSLDMALRVEATAQPLAVETGVCGEAKLGEPYSVLLEARGGSGPYTWSLSSGTLPPGLTLTAATGLISGTPNSVSIDPTPTFTVRAQDAVAAAATQVLSIRVRRPNADYLYLASSASNLYRFDGSTWTVATADTGGPPDARAERVAVLDKEFWVAWDNQLAKAEANPLERDNYAGAILLEGSDVTQLGIVGNVLYIFKRDGVFTINEDGSSQNILPQLRDVQITDNGQGSSVWLDSLWTPMGNAFYRVKADGTFTPVGTEQLLENASEVRGRITCSAGHNTWHLYEGLFNPATGDSYLLKYGTWVENEDLGESRERSVTSFRAAHHGALKKWTAKQITAMAILTAADLGTSNDRLYCGFSDGTIEWCILPRYNPNPLSDNQCEFHDQRAYLHYPGHHAGFAADVKNFRGFSVFGPVLSNLLPARISYRIDPTSGFTTLSDEDAQPIDFIADGQRFNVPGATLIGKTIEFRVELIRMPGASVNTSPLIFGVAIHEQLRPAFVLEWAATIDATTAVCRHDGTAERRSPDQVREALRVACAAFTPTTMVGPDGVIDEFGFLDYREEQRAYNHRYGGSWDIQIRAMQYRTLSNLAQAQGLSHATLETYDHADLVRILRG